ncbi:unnamed protein product [Pylaiella littoralis]
MWWTVGPRNAWSNTPHDLGITKVCSGFPDPPGDFPCSSPVDRNTRYGMDEIGYYETSGFNLRNLPSWPGSILRYFKADIAGLTSPWLYLGTQYATFAWHVEDSAMYSVNFHHSGASKQWYGVPGSSAADLEKCLAKNLGATSEPFSDHLYSITKMLSPSYLMQDGVPVCRVLQNAGHFVVTFPNAYHGGFSYGFNCGEAVNFAVPRWFPESRDSVNKYRLASRVPAVSHDKMVTAAMINYEDFDQQDRKLVLEAMVSVVFEDQIRCIRLKRKGVRQAPTAINNELKRFRLDRIQQDSEDYDVLRLCKTCRQPLFMTGVACACPNSVDVSCLHCVEKLCDMCPMSGKVFLSWTKKQCRRIPILHALSQECAEFLNGPEGQEAIANFRENHGETEP